MRRLKEEALALLGTLAVVCIGSLVFVTITMPFVFPFVVAGVVALVWRNSKRSTPASGSPVGPRRRVKRLGRPSPSPMPA